MPPKFAFFLRKVVHRILPVREALGRRGLVGDVVCPVCRLEGESLEHLFFSCEEARRVWRAGIKSGFGLFCG